jgi:glucose-6-phosphate dehydrogenase assembly protein OpcA
MLVTTEVFHAEHLSINHPSILPSMTDSSSLQTFTTGDATPVGVSQIERELRALWRHGAESERVARACLFNLIAWCESESDREVITKTIGGLTRRHPCRAIVLLAEPERAEPLLEAAISAHCHLAGGGRGHVCSEQISIRAAGESVAQLAPTVFSLVESDLPTVLWWRGNFLESQDFFRRLLTATDRVIFDSARWPDAECWLPVLAAEIHGTPPPVFADLNWTRLTLWRRLTADCFDDPAFRVVLPRLERVCVSHGGGAGARLRALLYAGWLADKLGWPPRDAAARFMFRQCSGRDVAEIGIESVELCAADARILLRKNFEAHTATATMTMPDVCRLARQQAFAALSETALLAQELDHVAPHAAYERALASASAMATGKSAA